jgi:hypothetical protein
LVERSEGINLLRNHVHQQARGVIRNTLAELDARLIVRLRIAVEGEVLGELIRVAREIMADRIEEAKSVGVVLSAAAYRRSETFVTFCDVGTAWKTAQTRQVIGSSEEEW